MNRVKYRIISTGSKGNAVVLNDSVLIDCGVPFKAIKPYVGHLQLVLLTHIHGDHFNRTTLRTLTQERPTLRFGCCKWLALPLTECGVAKHSIDVFNVNMSYQYGICKITPVPLVHNVPNCGYKLEFADGGKAIYCTDTNSLDGIAAKGYDLFMVEANYDDEEIRQRIDNKRSNGEYVYELQVLRNHLSKKKCDAFVYGNIGTNGEYIYMHGHEEVDSSVSQLQERYARLRQCW